MRSSSLGRRWPSSRPGASRRRGARRRAATPYPRAISQWRWRRAAPRRVTFVLRSAFKAVRASTWESTVPEAVPQPLESLPGHGNRPMRGLTTSKCSSSACLGRTPIAQLAVVKTLGDGLGVEACIQAITAPSPSLLLSRRALLNHRTTAATKSLQRNRGACAPIACTDSSEAALLPTLARLLPQTPRQRTPSCIEAQK